MLRLKELRNKRNITQQVIADLLNITRAAYSNIENGKRDPDTKTLIQLADYFNVSIDYLVGRVDIPYTEEYIYKAEEDFLKHCKTEDESRGLNLLKYSLHKNLPLYYKDPILRKQNYSLEKRAKILSILKTILNDFKKSIISFENARKKSEPNIFNNISMFIDYYLQKIGLKNASVIGIDHEDRNRKLESSYELHQLLHEGIDSEKN